VYTPITGHLTYWLGSTLPYQRLDAVPSRGMTGERRTGSATGRNREDRHLQEIRALGRQRRGPCRPVSCGVAAVPVTGTERASVIRFARPVGTFQNVPQTAMRECLRWHDGLGIVGKLCPPELSSPSLPKRLIDIEDGQTYPDVDLEHFIVKAPSAAFLEGRPQ
jgi:hypothetical protein